MPVTQQIRDNIKQNLLNYGNAVYALNILGEVLKGHTVKIESARTILESENLKKEKNILALIENLAKANAAATWATNAAGQQELNATITLDNNCIFEVKLTKQADGKVKINVQNKYVQSQPGGRIEIQREETLPEFIYDNTTQKIEIHVADSFSAEGHSVVTFDKDKPKPRALQGEVIKNFAEYLDRDDSHNAAFALLGTGTGKSWVIAGVAHSLPGKSVIVVPNATLAEEAEKDAIKILHGKSANVVHAFDKSIEDLRISLQDTTAHIILRADDPDFHAKSALIRDRVVCIDESHQHTYTDAGTRNLNMLKEYNVLLALTGTATTRLARDVFNNEVLMEKNLDWAVKNGVVRRMYTEVRKEIPAEKLAVEAVVDYFANDKYLHTSGKGLLRTEEVRESVAQELATTRNAYARKDVVKRAVNKLIATNRLRGSEQKNFFFSGDRITALHAHSIYSNIARGECRNEEILSRIQYTRNINELQQRIEYYQAIGLDCITANTYAQEDMLGRAPLTFENLKQETQIAQKKQIAQSVSAHAMSIFFGNALKDCKVKDFEKALRVGQINAHLRSTVEAGPINMVENEINARMKDITKSINAIIGNNDIDAFRIAEINDFIGEATNIPNGLILDTTHTGYTKENIKEIIKHHLEQNLTFESVLNEKLNEVESNLPADQRAVFRNSVAMTVMTLKREYYDAAQQHVQAPAATSTFMQYAKALFGYRAPVAARVITKVSDNLFKMEDVNLDAFGASYVTEARPDHTSEQDKTTLAKLRTGLTMHVASTGKFTTGVSIPSVLSTQQMIRSNIDATRDVVETLQLFGRPIRDKDLGAKVSQFVAEGVEVYTDLEEAVLAEEQAAALRALAEREDALQVKLAEAGTEAAVRQAVVEPKASGFRAAIFSQRQQPASETQATLTATLRSKL